MDARPARAGHEWPVPERIDALERRLLKVHGSKGGQAMNQSVANDLQIDRDVRDELVREARGRVRDVAVSVHEGIVELSGVAASWGEHEEAREAAHRVVGVVDVENRILVSLSADSQRSDTELAQAVQRALEWDARLAPARVHATVSTGIVTLAGSVDSSNQSDAASRCVRDLVGVREVRNLLHVEGAIAPNAYRPSSNKKE